MKSIQDFIKLVRDCFDINYARETENHYIFKIKGNLNGEFTDVESTVDKKEFNQILIDEKSYKKNVNSIHRVGYFECLVKNDRISYLNGYFNKEVSRDDYKFKIGSPSTQLLLSTLFNLSNGNGYSARNTFFENYEKNAKYFNEELDRYDTIEQIKSLADKLISVKVECSNCSYETLRKLAKSYLYELNSSFGEAFTTVEVSVYDLFRSNQHYGPIRKKYDEISAPEKIYDDAILSYYQRAISTNNIEFQFLSFYQIIEYFYDIYFIDEMSSKLLAKHSKTPLDINDNEFRSKIISDVVKEYKRQNEKESFKGVLKANIRSKEDFRNRVNTVDDSLFNYLKEQWPGFLDLGSINYDLLSIEEFISKLSMRIYRIRNEVTHKKSQKTKYIPQQHERYLLHETRLIQIIVELIIENNGKEYVSQQAL